MAGAKQVLAIVLLASVWSGRAEAQPSELGLAWQAPASCPDAASVRARIAQRLERSLAEIPAGIAIEVAVLHGRFVATIDLRAITVANDVRHLTSTRCSELADAVAVIVARVANEAGVRRAAEVREVRHQVAAHDPADDDRVAVHAAAPAPVLRPRLWSIGLRLSGVSGIGVIPRVGLGGELALTVRRRSTLAEIAETRWVKSAAQVHAGAPARVDVSLDVTAFRAGWRPERMPLRAWTAVEVGSMHGNGVALASPQIGSGRWVAAGAGFGVAWQMTPWIRLVGSTEVLLAIERVRFSLGEGMTVYAPAPMSARATCGLEAGWQ